MPWPRWQMQPTPWKTAPKGRERYPEFGSLQSGKVRSSGALSRQRSRMARPCRDESGLGMTPAP
jgi:hypothetical protein